jgi:hypothetical protein
MDDLISVPFSACFWCRVSAPPLAPGAASVIDRETFSILDLFFHSMFDVRRSFLSKFHTSVQVSARRFLLSET